MRDERRVETLTAGNRRVKEARKLSRRSVRTERRLFLADGPKAVEGALSAVLDDGTPCVVEVFATPAAARQHAAVLDGAPVTLVDERALAALSDAVTPAGVVAVCRHLDVPLSTLLRPPVGGRAAARNEGRPPEVGGRAAARNERRVETIAVCADVRDPGNAGTVIRTADAAGADAVVLAGSSVDAYNPKTVRATVGSLFRLPVAIEPDPRSAVEAARSAGLTVLAADGGGELDLFATDDLLAGPTAWLFGNEARGLPADLAALADHRVAIPILGGAESLNLSTAAAVCLYASARVKRAARSASEERA